MTAKVLVVCANAWDDEGLAHPRVAARAAYVHAGRELLEDPSLLDAIAFDPFRYARRLGDLARRERVDGVVGTGDYPGCMLAALVAADVGLRAPRPHDVVALSHKVESRAIQRAVVPEATPAYTTIDPAAPHPGAVGFPIFVKPVKGTMSIRARLARDEAELREALRFGLREAVRGRLLMRPFDRMLRRLRPAAAPAHFFIGEQPLRGDQVTVDGFVSRGRVVVMGVVDSVMYPGTNSFLRFDHPSRLAPDVVRRMKDTAERLVAGSGFDDGCFNVEMFHDPQTGRISIIEVNPRMSYQFADLYEKVDGATTYEVQIALALGEDPPWRAGGGRWRYATSFVLRRFADARVVRVPDARDLAALRARCDDVVVKTTCVPGLRLSDLDQDVGSYRYGIVNLGGDTPAELDEKWAAAKALLPYEFVD